MADVYSLALKISAQGTQHLTSVRRGMERIDSAAAKVGLTMRNLKRGVLAVGAAGAGLTYLSVKLLKLGSDALETRNKFEMTFGDAAKSVDAFLEEFNKMSGMSKAQAENLVADMGHIAQGLGLAQQASAEFAVEITKLAGDLASFKNVGADRAAMAIMSAMTGEREQLKQLGIVLRQVDVDQRALVMSGKTLTSQLNDMDRSYASLALITERAGIAVGDLARTSDSTANVMRQLAGAWLTLRERIGEFLAESPIVNAFLIQVRDMFTRMTMILNGQREDIRELFEALGDMAGSAFFGGIAKAFEKIGAIPGTFINEKYFKRKADEALENFVGAYNYLGVLAERVAERPAPRGPGLGLDALTGGRMPVVAPGGQAMQLPGINVGAQRPVERKFTGQYELVDLSDYTRAHQDVADKLAQYMPTMMDFQKETDVAAEKLKMLATASLHASVGLVQMIKSGGSAGGILGGIMGVAGGIIGAVNPLAGAALAAGGGILAGLTASSNKPTPVSIERYSSNALSQRRDEPEPVNVTFIVESGGKEIKRIARVLRRAELRDGVIRGVI